MLISELIQKLEKAKESYGDIQVMTSSDYGDHCHTEQLNHVAAVEPAIPQETAYSDTGLRFPDPDLDEDIQEDPDREEVLVLRYTYR